MPPTLRLNDVKPHNKKGDCWVVVHSRIYDITDYLDSHPGGPDSLLADLHHIEQS